MRKPSYEDLKRMRESRNNRIAAIKSEATNKGQEYLLLGNLPKGVKLWWPEGDKAQEVFFRISDFEVTQKNNVAGEPVGAFSALRNIHVHTLPNKKVVVCPQCWDRECPLCTAVHEHYEEIKANQKHPLAKFKARRVTLFNALFKEAGPNGKVKIVPKVVRGSSFFLMNTLNKALSEEEQFNETKTNEIYAYSDLELGYWIKARFGMAAAVEGNSKKFMQMLSAELDWQKKYPIPDGAYPYIVDLDTLIPQAPSYEELARWLGDVKEPEPETIVASEPDVNIGADEDDAIDCGPTEPPVEETITEEEVDAIPEDIPPFTPDTPEVKEEPKAPKKAKAKAPKKEEAPAEKEATPDLAVDADTPTPGGDDFINDFSDADFGDEID